VAINRTWSYSLIIPKVDLNVFFHTMQSLRTLTKFGAAFKNTLSQKDRFSSLKSHDYNNLICFVLPIAIRGFVTKGVCQAVFKLARFFHWVCSKNVDVRDLESHEDRVCHSDESFGNATSNIFFG